jgi:outer membrane PBP1 activator LpoA protein
MTLGSCASVRPTARAPAPAPPPATAPATIIAVPAPAGPAPPAAVTTPMVQVPPIEVPAATRALPASPDPVSVRGPPGPDATIALILPLDAKPFARAAEAVRAGFLAAASAAGDQSHCIVIAHGEDGVLAAFEDARARDVQIIIGPLLRDDLKAVAQLALDLPFTIALNQLDEGTPSLPHLYTFSLAIESDARLIARRIRAEAAPSVAVVGAETPLMKRFAAAFATEWLAEGGSMPDVYRFDGTPEALTAMRRDLVRRRTTSAIVLAVDSANATLAKPYLGTIPAYASGLVFERETQAVTRDLDGLVLVEIPWIIAPDAAQFATLPKQEFPNAALLRLYALGLDAYRVARAFRNGPPERFMLEGATGQVTLVDGRQFAREGRFAVFRGGKLTPLDVSR